MFARLPESLKQQVLYYLSRDNFPEAKAIYDTWKNTQNSYPTHRSKIREKVEEIND